MKVKVISEFQDKFTKQLYQPGQVIEIEDEARVEDLKSRRLAEPVEEKKPVGILLFEKEFEKKALVEALKSVGAQATGTMGEKTLLEKVAGLDEESAAKLKDALGV
ncbi:hypothetical protein [Bacteroides sp.]|uniref:hypothetical protein n=1 Tax=Bacteroides sp. TaxID=29523 RepID=UPI00262D61E2|nr:hypothetical protein [Bacteroides sp.]